MSESKASIQYRLAFEVYSADFTCRLTGFNLPTEMLINVLLPQKKSIKILLKTDSRVAYSIHHPNS